MALLTCERCGDVREVDGKGKSIQHSILICNSHLRRRVWQWEGVGAAQKKTIEQLHKTIDGLNATIRDQADHLAALTSRRITSDEKPKRVRKKAEESAIVVTQGV